jgi:hypothetical protein
MASSQIIAGGYVSEGYGEETEPHHQHQQVCHLTLSNEFRRTTDATIWTQLVQQFAQKLGFWG